MCSTTCIVWFCNAKNEFNVVLVQHHLQHFNLWILHKCFVVYILMLKRNCALKFMYNCFVTSRMQTIFGVNIEDNVSYILDSFTQYLTSWIPFKITRR